MQTVIKVYDNGCKQLNDYLNNYGNNLTADDDILRRKSNVVADGVRILREKLIVPRK